MFFCREEEHRFYPPLEFFVAAVTAVRCTLIHRAILMGHESRAWLVPHITPHDRMLVSDIIYVAFDAKKEERWGVYIARYIAGSAEMVLPSRHLIEQWGIAYRLVTSEIAKEARE